METPPKLPPVFQNFEQKAKKKAERNNTVKLILGCIIILAGIGTIKESNFLTSVCLILCGFLLIPHVITSLEKKIKFSFKILKYFLIVGLFICAALADNNINGNKKEGLKSTFNNDSTARIAEKPNYTPEILKKETIANGQVNYWVMVNDADLSAKNIERIAVELENKFCTGNCVISLYDNKNAFLIDEAYEKKNIELGQMLSNGKLSKEQYKIQLKNYEKKYYIKIADHLLGFLSHLDSDDFYYYPYRDKLYKELGGKDEPMRITTDTISSNQEQAQTENDAQLGKEEIDSKARDAVAILEVYVKQNMNDADSFEEVSYDYSYHGTYFIILLKYRGKNGFGAKVINYIKAKTDLDGNVIAVLEE